MREIRAFARQIAREFRPRRIILFGSYAYGMPTRDSDVDLLVVFAGRGDVSDQSLEIRRRLDAGFPVDVLARSEGEIQTRLALNDWFLHEVMQKGKTLYESADARVGRQGRRRLRGRAPRAAGA